MTRLRLGVVVMVGVACAAPTASAHSVGWSIVPEDDAVVLQFSYGSGAPMAFAEVTVTAPQGLVFQKGRADRAGKFAIVVPQDVGDGLWNAAVVDGEGHKLIASFQKGSEARVVHIRHTVGQALGFLTLVLLAAILTLSALLERARKALRLGHSTPPLAADTPPPQMEHRNDTPAGFP